MEPIEPKDFGGTEKPKKNPKPEMEQPRKVISIDEYKEAQATKKLEVGLKNASIGELAILIARGKITEDDIGRSEAISYEEKEVLNLLAGYEKAYSDQSEYVEFLKSALGELKTGKKEEIEGLRSDYEEEIKRLKDELGNLKFSLETNEEIKKDIDDQEAEEKAYKEFLEEQAKYLKDRVRELEEQLKTK